MGPDTLFHFFAFVLGACVGSFLNVCIYRLPRDLSVNQPRRSFCPFCKHQIPWYQNLPLVSWLALRGRCRNCGARISFRYFAVELFTAVLFLVIWNRFPPSLAIIYWIFVSLVIAATFIDFEHFIIPDEITIGGVGAGVVAAAIVPQLMATDSRVAAIIRSVLAALLGYVLLWLVLEGGKLVFGKKRIRLEKPTSFTWKRNGEDADFIVGEEKSLWSEFFARESDQLQLHCPIAHTLPSAAGIGGEEQPEPVTVAAREFSNALLRFHYNRLEIGGEVFDLDKIDEISGTTSEIQIPREAMGRGDLKFLAAIGAFLGWRAILFSVFAGSLYGSIVGLITLVVGKRVWSLKLPFGPYLALGAITWLFFGEELIRWYQTLLTPGSLASN